MLRNILSLQVPELAGRQVRTLLTKMLERLCVERKQISAWILHPGGRDVLLALRDRLALEKQDLNWSAQVLRDFGNVSSPSVFFVLERALAANAPGGFWLMSSFGAGFSCHAALWEVE